MTHVVTENCVRCRYTDCVDVCPVEAFREGENCLVIAPDECIDCTLCVEQCPVHAIYADDDLPPKWTEWIDLNARLAPRWPIISRSRGPLPDHAEHAALDDKRAMLSERPSTGE